MNVASLSMIIIFVSNLLISLAMAVHGAMPIAAKSIVVLLGIGLGLILGIASFAISSKILRLDEKYLPWSLLLYMVTPVTGLTATFMGTPLLLRAVAGLFA